MSENTMELDLKNKTAKLTGNDIFTMVGAVATVALLVGGYFHHIQGEKTAVDSTAAVRELAKATREQTMVQRARNCLDKFKLEEKHQYAAWCDEVTGVTKIPNR